MKRGRPGPPPGSEDDAEVEVATESDESTWSQAAAFAIGACVWMVLWLFVLFWAANRDRPGLILLFGFLWALFAVVLGRHPLAIVRHNVLDGDVADSGEPEEGLRIRQRVVGAIVTIIVGIIALMLWWLALGTDEWLFVGFIISLVGVSLLVGAIRETTWAQLKRGIVIIGSCVGAFLIGLLLLPVVPTWGGILLAAAVLLFPVGLSWLSGDVLRIVREDSPAPRYLIAAALLLMAIGLVVFIGIGLPPLMAIGGVAFFVLLVGAIASNTSTDITIVLVAVALVWSLAPRGVDATEQVIPSNGEAVLIAFGDSYMSGEGAEEFFIGTNSRGQNECRRAPSAYAALVTGASFDVIPHDVVFLACSGARARHIYRDGQYPDEPIGGGGSNGAGLTQLDHWRWVADSVDLDLRLVIVSIGGNDALFGEVGRACVLPGDCSQIGARWLTNLETTVASNVATAFREIRGEFPSTPVVAVPYPMPLRERACDWSTLTDNEHRFIHGFVLELNKVVERTAANEGLHYLRTMESSLAERNLRICDRGPGSVGVHFLDSNPVEGRLSDTLNPRHWFHNSLHPNPLGHVAMRNTLTEWIQAHPVLVPAQPAEAPTSPTVASIEAIMGGSQFRHCGTPGSGLDHCDDVSEWTVAQLLGFAWPASIALFLLIAGSWLMWLQVLRSQRVRGLVERMGQWTSDVQQRNRQQTSAVLQQFLSWRRRR